MGKSRTKSRTSTKRRLFNSRTPRNRKSLKPLESSPDTTAEFYSIVRLLAELEALECLTNVNGVNIAENRVRTMHNATASACTLNNPVNNPVNNKPRKKPATTNIKLTSKETPKDYYLSSLLRQLSACLDRNPLEKTLKHLDEAEDPASTPVYWVSKWVDYSDKYGLGYALCDNSIGVLFNDQTRLVLHGDKENLKYIQEKGQETSFTIKGFPKNLEKKVKLINFFNNYMKQNLLQAGGTQGTVQDGKPSQKAKCSHLPYLRYWYTKVDGIVLHLSNGLLQINFFKDHTKIFLCPVKRSVTYIDKKKRMHSFPFKNLEKYGCSKEIHTRLSYARQVIKELLKKLKENK